MASTIFFVAEDQGFFAQEGLKVSIAPCMGAFQCMDDMLAGRSSFAIGGDFAIMFRGLERADFAVLATFASSTSVLKLLARSSANVHSAKDLVGKRIGVIRKSASHYFLHLYLLAGGVDPHRIRESFMEPSEMANAFARGDVDALSTYEPLASKLQGDFGKAITEIVVPAMLNLGTHLVVRRQSKDDSNADAVQVLRALKRAEQFIHTEPAKAMQIWIKQAGISPSEAQLAWSGTKFKLTLDPSLATTLQSAARWAQLEGLEHTSRLPDFRNFIDTAPLAKAKPEGLLK